MKLFLPFLIMAVVLVSCAPAPGVKDKFVIGAVLPLTGWNSFNGEFSRVGIDAAVADLNAAGGINGQEVVVIYEEGAEKTQATLATQKLISIDHADAFVSTTTAVAGAIAPVAEENKVPFVYISATNSFAQNTSYIFKDYPDAFDQCNQLLAQARKDGHTKVAVFGTNLEFSEYCVRALRNEKEFSVYEYYPAGETDFRTHFDKIAASGSTALIVSVVAADCPYMYKQLSERKDKLQLYIVFQSLGCGNSFHSANYASLLNDAYGADIPEELVFAGESEKYKERFSKAGSPNLVGSALMYDAVQQIAHAANGCSDRICIADNLRKLSMVGLTGEISYGGDQIVERKSVLTHFNGSNWRMVSE